MHRIDNASANPVMPTRGNPGPNVDAFFDNANQTVVPDDFLNAIQEELMTLLAAAAISPDKADDTQVHAALVSLGLRAATSVLNGTARLATVAEVIAGVNTNTIVTPAALQTLVASTVADGIVRLATNSETVIGSSTSTAVTPAALANKITNLFTMTKGVPFSLATFTSGLTNKGSIDFGVLDAGDMILLHGEIRGNKGATSGTVTLEITKSSGPAIEIYQNSELISHQFSVFANDGFLRSLPVTMIRATAAGTLVMSLDGKSAGSDATSVTFRYGYSIIKAAG